MGLAAIAYSSRGEKVILGAAAVPTRRPMLVEVRAAINVFLGKLRNHRGAEMAIIVPIVEWSGRRRPATEKLCSPPARHTAHHTDQRTHTGPGPGPTATTTKSTHTNS